MSRNPTPHKLGNRNQPPDMVLGDPAPAEVYEFPRGGRAVPERSHDPVIGPACPDALGARAASAPYTTEENQVGVDLGRRGNNEQAKAAQEFGDSVREPRGVRTRPVSPGQHA